MHASSTCCKAGKGRSKGEREKAAVRIYAKLSKMRRACIDNRSTDCVFSSAPINEEERQKWCSKMFIAFGLYALTFEICPIVVELTCLSLRVLGVKKNKRARVEEFKQTVENLCFEMRLFQLSLLRSGCQGTEVYNRRRKHSFVKQDNVSVGREEIN